MIKAIIFDVDGVILNSKNANGRYLWSSNISQDLGMKSEHFRILHSLEWNHVTRGHKDTIAHLEEIFKHPTFVPLRLTPEKYIEYWLKRDNFVNHEVLAIAQKMVLPKYIGTNQDKFRTAHIKQLVGTHFDGCFASYEIGFIKPEQGFYAHIERHLDLAPEELLLIDDTKANVTAAQQRGWQGYHFIGDVNLLALFVQHLGKR